ncbi:hypothetical protein [Pontibacter ruber]|uniref:Uncharacterized protein n=1 Tax=Pontibacter ruber TaxID=1343895 RepID=A0ABW5CTX2_9BACT|nr:hypothetical protein [Pontibacter ruber]
MQAATELREIYITPAGAVYQCDRKNRLMVDFAGTLSVLKIDTFLRLKHAIDKIDLQAMVTSTDRSSDVEIISVLGTDKVYVLTMPELHAFKELLAGARFVLELNSMLHECLNAELA